MSLMETRVEAGIPFVILTLISTPILFLWAINGVGKNIVRYIVATVMIGTLVVSWVLVVSFGAFNYAGQLGLAIGFLVAITAFFVPTLHKRWVSDEIDS